MDVNDFEELFYLILQKFLKVQIFYWLVVAYNMYVKIMNYENYRCFRCLLS
jgi:hypothetical protein